MNFSMHGLSVKSDTGGKWDWEMAASLFNQDKDTLRTSGGNFGTTSPDSATGGKITFTDGTGWQNLDLRGEWRPEGDRKSKHQLSFGYHTDTYITKSDTYNLVAGSSWLTDAAGCADCKFKGQNQYAGSVSAGCLATGSRLATGRGRAHGKLACIRWQQLYEQWERGIQG